jgi:hypothetical protein
MLSGKKPCELGRQSVPGSGASESGTGVRGEAGTGQGVLGNAYRGTVSPGFTRILSQARDGARRSSAQRTKRKRVNGGHFGGSRSESYPGWNSMSVLERSIWLCMSPTAQAVLAPGSAAATLRKLLVVPSWVCCHATSPWQTRSPSGDGSEPRIVTKQGLGPALSPTKGGVMAHTPTTDLVRARARLHPGLHRPWQRACGNDGAVRGLAAFRASAVPPSPHRRADPVFEAAWGRDATGTG